MKNDTKKWLNKMQSRLNKLSKKKQSPVFNQYPDGVMIYDKEKDTIIINKKKIEKSKNLLALTGDEEFESKIVKMILIFFIILLFVIILIALFH